MQKELDLVVLAHTQSPLHLAYLTYLHRNGYTPKKILALTIVPSTGKTQLLKRFVGEHFTAVARRVVQTLVSFPRRRQIRSLMNRVQAGHEPIDFQRLPRLSAFASEVEQVFADSLEDPRLLNAVRAQEPKALLFTGGGIVGPSLLEKSGKTIFHVHPGLVPEVKGSDGFLWSSLVRGAPGYSCFYMNAGIDTGDIILTKEFDPVRLPDCDQETPDQLYDAILRFLDPHLRAQTFVDVVKMSEEQDQPLDQLPSRRQDPNEGRTYFFMQSKLKRIVVESLIR